MAYWMQNYLITMVMAILVTALIIPGILSIAFRKKLFDRVNDRKVHHGVVPRLGGMAFVPAITFAFCLVVGYNLRYHFLTSAPAMEDVTVPFFFLMCILMLIFLIGLTDDLVGVKYSAKFLMQIFIGILILLSGIGVYNLYGFLWIGGIPSWLGWIITVFGIIYVINAVNLIDGIDGLAAGLSAVSLTLYSYVFYISHTYGCMLLAGATLGTLIPFFYYNVYGKTESHTKIFMGDTGSLTIGAIQVFLTIEVLNLAPSSIEWGGNLFVVAMSPILLPCFDVARVFIHRIRNGRNPFLPDKSHIHHKLLAIGMKQWQVLVVILTIDVVIVVSNVLLSPHVQPTWLILGDILFLAAFNGLITRIIRAREARTGAVLYE